MRLFGYTLIRESKSDAMLRESRAWETKVHEIGAERDMRAAVKLSGALAKIEKQVVGLRSDLKRDRAKARDNAICPEVYEIVSGGESYVYRCQKNRGHEGEHESGSNWWEPGYSAGQVIPR